MPTSAAGRSKADSAQLRAALDQHAPALAATQEQVTVGETPAHPALDNQLQWTEAANALRDTRPALACGDVGRDEAPVYGETSL